MLASSLHYINRSIIYSLAYTMCTCVIVGQIPLQIIFRTQQQVENNTRIGCICTEAESDIPVLVRVHIMHSHASSATPMDKMAIAEELTWEVKTGETNELSQ